MVMHLSEAARVLDARQFGPDAEFRGISIDSRTLEQGDLFIALRGPHFDGHAFVDQALQNGAAAVAVSRPLETEGPYVLVPDTRLALAELAYDWRERFSIPVVGITGSNGKTTVKTMCAAILGCRGEVMATHGNLNNEIGVPLTILRLTSRHRFAVVEMGANHPGEIAGLAAIARPTVGIITNAGAAHLKGFGSVDGVARSKGELLFRLAPGGVAVFRADEPYALLWREIAGSHEVRTFGLDVPADVQGRWESSGSASRLHITADGEEIDVSLALPGRHNAMNALAATAGCLSAGATLQDVKKGLESLQPIRGRLQRHVLASGATLIDDTYNANPGSLQAALDVLGDFEGERWLVLGDMGELGDDAEELHREAGRQARAAGITRLFALGSLAAEAAAAFGGGGQHYPDFPSLLTTLQAELHPSVVVLVKGSRAMAMDRVVEALAPAGGGN